MYEEKKKERSSRTQEDLFDFESALETRGVLIAASDDEHRLLRLHFLGESLDLLVQLKRLLQLV